MTNSGPLWLSGLAAIVLAWPAQAQEVETSLKPILNMRLRAEQVDQKGLDTTTALTLAGRFGLEAAFGGGWSALAEGEAVGHLNEEFSDTVRNIPGKAVVADPEALELNRLQIGWKGKSADVTLGRQRIIFDDARFVGNVGFRQNEQTFDALRLGFFRQGSASAEYAYIDKVHRVFGDESAMGEFESDSHIVRAGFDSRVGKFVVTGLFLDFDESAAASGQTLALAWSDTWKFKSGTLGLNARFAQQREYNGKGPEQDLGYQSFGANLALGELTFIAGAEILEGAGGAGFVTPLATLHAFQGWADVFLNTPQTGVRDLSIGLTRGGIKLIDGAKPASWAVFYHNFDSDNGRLSYGSEFDAVFRVPLNERLTLEAKGAVFNSADAGPADRTKLWLALEARL